MSRVDRLGNIERQPTLEESIERMLRVGHEFWERHEHSPDSDEMSAALTDLYFALQRNRGAVEERDAALAEVEAVEQAA